MNIQIKSPIAILGYGVEGKAAIKFLKTQGISDITVCDENENMEIPKNLKSKLGSDAFKNLTGFETIMRSPGVRYNLPGIMDAKDAGITVTSTTDLTLKQAWERLTAITGSSGKTTTVGMLEQILKKHYKDKIIIGGNDRSPILQEVMQNTNEPILMEVSSFQFADINKSPHIAAIINITPNHLDWHEDLADYIHAKNNLIAHQTPNDWAILNANNEDSAKLAESAPSNIFWIGKKTGKAWAIWEGDTLVAQFGAQPIEILKRSDLTIKTHPDNILCAVAISLIHEVSTKTIKTELANFKGVKHRLEFVKEIDDVKFYNDSACTTPESSILSITQFPKGKLILLLGGSTKNAEFSFMAHHIVESKTRVMLYGVEGTRIKEAIKAEGGSNLIIDLDETNNFKAIILKAKITAHPGDNVVLSPACASFDMFRNAKYRGKEFKEIVRNL